MKALRVLMPRLYIAGRRNKTELNESTAGADASVEALSHETTVDSRYSGSLKYGHLDIPAIWLGTEC